jgi:RNA polymerase sigma factor (sigma-70 family)
MHQPRTRLDQPPTALLLDAHELLRLGLRAVLEKHRAVTVVGEARAIAEAVECTARLRPTLVISGVALADGDAADACRRIIETAPGTRVAVLGDDADDDAALGAVRAGASAYLSSRISGPDLCQAIRAIAIGEVQRDPIHVPGQRHRDGRMRDDLSTLAPQERRVLRLVAEGKTNKEIGAALHLSEKTVKNYLSHAFEKLQVSSRAQAAVLFVRDRLGFELGLPGPDGAGPTRSGRPDPFRAPALPLGARGVASAAGPGVPPWSSPGGQPAMVVDAGEAYRPNGRR